MEKKIAVYAGMFDPPTVGHLWVVDEGLKIFDELVVVVATNGEKTPLFSVEERVPLLREILGNRARVTVQHCEKEFVVDFAASVHASFLIRSIRTESDYGYERMLHYTNTDIRPDIRTVFLIPPREISEVSSRMIKQLVGLKGWEQVVAAYVPSSVLTKLREKSP